MNEALFTEIEQAQTLVQVGLPQLEITPSDCNCCCDWWFKESEIYICSWFGPSLLLEIWDLLWIMVDSQFVPGNSFTIDLSGDQREASVGFRFLTENEIQIGVKSQDAGPVQYLSFRSEREPLIALLSEQMHLFTKHPLYRPNMDRIEEMEFMAIAATAPEWPWTLFPLWYTLKNELMSWQINWLIFTTLENAPQFSQLNDHKKDPIDDLLIQCYWNCILCYLLPNAVENESDYSQRLQAYKKESQQIFAFAMEMGMKWRDGYVYRDESNLNFYYDRNRSYLEHTHQYYLARMRWWISHLKFAARHANPELYDWVHMQSWEENLGKTQPELYQQLGLKWRQNAIWKACFGPDS
ncbi:MAG: hypothetical protein IV090_18775 [Candidatus Sericytochromatia bacterium]|nr:hypothetical protein [Candidatus Sericytochromatia bacterium]